MAVTMMQSCANCPDDCGPCQAASQVFGCVESRTIAFSFNDGPSAVTNHLLDILGQYNIPVGFFLNGDLVETHRPQVLREEAMGFSTLSHTFSNLDLALATPATVYNELYKTEVAIKRR